MPESNTDCRSEDGITVGLIDALISICRVLAPRDLETWDVRMAIDDLIQDEDFQKIIHKYLT